MIRRRRVDRAVARDIVGAVRRVSDVGLVAGTVGNVSARVADGMLITPSRTPYDNMAPFDVVFVASDGSFDARATPSTEWPLHLAVYDARPDAGAVIHTHSLHATAWA